jgi:large subunit ribosomal protein L24
MSKAKSRIRRDDTVVVVAGKHKGVRGRVLKVWPSEQRVLVEGVNVIKRHQKPVGD